MTIESVLYARLTGFSGLAVLIGERVHSVPAPQGVVLPFITYEQISAIREDGMGGWVDAVTTRFQIDVMAKTATSRNAVAIQTIEAFREWRDPASDPVAFGASIENDQRLYDDDTAIHRAIIDLVIDHREG